MGGEVNILFADMLAVTPQLDSGKLRALAVTTAKRSTLAPELPTVAESGLPGFDVAGWYGFVAPAKTPPDIVRKLNLAINYALASPELVERLRALGLEPVGGTPEAAALLIRNEVARWNKVVRDARIPPQ